jgi:hypothetical protein
MATLFWVTLDVSKADDSNNVLPVVSVLTATNATQSGSLSGVFTVQRTGDTGQALLVNYSIGGTASNGVDYERLSGAVTIPAGQSSASIAVAPIDSFVEGASKEVSVTLVARNQPFTLVALPDTQYYTAEENGATHDILTAQTQWVVDQKDEMNIAFVLHEGDMTDGNTSREWINAKASMSLLDGVVPYAITVGNHDGLMTSQSQTALFNQYFPLSQFQNLPTFGGVFESNRMDNCYHLFSAGGVDWLLFSLEFGPRNEVLDWANQVVTNYPDRRVIVLTHAHVYSDNTLQGSSPDQLWLPTSYGRDNNGTDVWEKFLRHYANMAFVFCGHVLNSGTGRLVGVGDYGNQVFQILANYQMDVLGGAGYLRIMQFFPDEDRMSVESYSPYLDTWLTTPDQQFEYTNLGVFTNANPGYLVDTQNASASLIITNDTVDLTPPEVDSVSYMGVPPIITVTFDEPVEAVSAQTLDNYAIDQGAVLASATLLPDGKTVALATGSDLVAGALYTLTVNHVKDCARATNEMNEPYEYTFTYVPVLLSDSFDEGTLQGWTIVDEGVFAAPSLWLERSGRLMQLSDIYGPSFGACDHRQGTYIYWNDPQALGWSNYAFSVTFNNTDNDGVGVLFRYQDSSNYYKVELDSQKNFRKLFEMVDGVETTLAAESASYSPGSSYVLRVEVTNSEITVLLDGAVLFGGTITDSNLVAGTVALYSWASEGLFFNDLNVTPPNPWPRVAFQSPTNGVTFSQPNPVPIALDVSDPDGQVEQVELFCGTSLLASLTNAPYVFQWNTSGSGYYTLTAQVVDEAGPIGVSSPVTFLVTPPLPKPQITGQPADQNVYAGESAMFCVKMSASAPMQYQWLFDGEPIDGATNAFLILDNTQPEQAGDYAVVATNALGEVVSETAILNVDPDAPPEANVSQPPSVCFPSVEVLDPGVTLISVAATNLQVLNIEWSSDCQTWNPFVTLTNNGGVLYFADPDAVNQPMRFYRAVAQP